MLRVWFWEGLAESHVIDLRAKYRCAVQKHRKYFSHLIDVGETRKRSLVEAYGQALMKRLSYRIYIYIYIRWEVCITLQQVDAPISETFHFAETEGYRDRSVLVEFRDRILEVLIMT